MPTPELAVTELMTDEVESRVNEYGALVKEPVLVIVTVAPP